MLFKKGKPAQQIIEEPSGAEIKTGQTLTLKNVLRYRAVIDQQELVDALQKIGAVIQAAGVKKEGYTATATHSIQMQNGQQIADMEINIVANNLQPCTPVYNVTVKDAFSMEEVNSMIIDLYIGIA